MKRASSHILRVGLAFTFLWIGVLILKNPEAWGGYLRPWAAGLLPIPLAQAMMGTAILDIAIGTFDACKGVKPGESWPFKFDIAGNWKYHDHLNPKNFGAIIVQ